MADQLIVRGSGSCAISKAQLSRAYSNDVGYDVATPRHLSIGPHARLVVDTRIRIEVPKGLWGELKSRSGLACKGLIVLGGVIDPGYTGRIRVILQNLTSQQQILPIGARIAQLVLHKVYTPTLQFVADPDPASDVDDADSPATESSPSTPTRGSSGLGSTGLDITPNI